ncbi:MAG: iron-containing alcohol dehydrogenase [Pseudomonadota bacterium]
MSSRQFSIARLPRIEFGYGVFAKVAGTVAAYGERVLVVTGARSFLDSAHWAVLQTDLHAHGVRWQQLSVDGEPSPVLIDDAVAAYPANSVDVVLGIGGGSALDAAKAIAGLIKVRRSVMDYLEGVGPELPYEGPAVPFIAVPTTAGTGSEATKNAVLSVQGREGFKKSFRDDKLVAEYTIVDPDLLASCPLQVIAANGMDALTQLIESYVSLRSNRFTRTLVVSGLRAVRDGLLPWYEGSAQAHQGREHMAYAALLSGITLAQTGLGSVHGLASPLGAFHPIPHGAVCGTLVAAATELNIRAMLDREPDNPALDRYARLASVLCNQHFSTREQAWASLVSVLESWTKHLNLPTLSNYGVERSGLDHVVAHSRGSSMKTNPIVLHDSEIMDLLKRRL